MVKVVKKATLQALSFDQTCITAAGLHTQGEQDGLQLSVQQQDERKGGGADEHRPLQAHPQRCIRLCPESLWASADV